MNIVESLKILFVVNLASGSKSKIDYRAIITAYFLELPHSIDFFLLTGKDDIESLKRIIQRTNPERVIAVGGDGTVSLVAKQLRGSSVVMGILPAGSANGMAKELDIPTDINHALEIVVNGKIKCADLIVINDREICLHLSDIGMNAQLIKYFNKGYLRGMLGYARVVLKVLVRKERMKVIIESRDEDKVRSAMMVAIANASKYGTGAIINPQGNIYDGTFEVVIVRKLDVVEILKMFLKFRRFNPKKIEVISAKSVTIETASKAHFQIDGEYFGKVDLIKAKILPAQLNLLIPSNGK